MGKKYVIVSIILSFITAFLLGVVMPNDLAYKKENMAVEMELRTDADTEIKVYYKTAKTEDFSEINAVVSKAAADSEFQKVYLEIPAEQITSLRIDWEPTVLFLDIKNIIIHAEEGRDELDSKEIDAFYKNDIEAAELSEDYLTVKSGAVDPYIVLENCSYNRILDRSVNFRLIVAAVIFAVLLFVLLTNHRPIVDTLKGIYFARKQVKSLAISDFKGRFSGSYLGMLWGVLQPLMTIVLFWFVFQVGFRSQPMSNAPFLLWLIAGMIPWNFFSDAWLNGNGTFTGYSYIVKKLVFNVDILPLVKILASFILNIIFNVIILVVYIAYGWFPGVHILDMVYFSFCLAALAWGLSMITASLNVFMKDVGQFLSIVMQFLMWLTPVMWDYHMVSEKMSWFYRWNPLFYIVNGYREALIDGKWFFTNYYMMLWFWIITITVCIVGIRLMRKLKPHFADVL